MEAARFLIRAFDYDLWANRQWIRSIGSFHDLERAQAVLEHILETQRWWLGACGVQAVQNRVDVGLADLFAETAAAWQALLESEDGETVYSVPMGEGESELSLIDIALQVVNHGTYHRGHLRGLGESEGAARFPDTDVVAYLMEARQG